MGSFVYSLNKLCIRRNEMRCGKEGRERMTERDGKKEQEEERRNMRREADRRPKNESLSYSVYDDHSKKGLKTTTTDSGDDRRDDMLMMITKRNQNQLKMSREELCVYFFGGADSVESGDKERKRERERF